MHSLPIFIRLTGRPVILIGEGEAADAKRRLLERAGAMVVGEEDAQSPAALIAIVAVEDDADAIAAAARLKQRGLLVNVVDRPPLCDFTMPAIVDRDPVLIAIGTGGASAGLAKAVRQRIERLLPSGLGSLATALAGARGIMRARWPRARDRRAAIDAALADGGALDPLRRHDEGAVETWIADEKTVTNDVSNDRVETILLASADPDDLTLRAARLLGEADTVLHDPAVPAALLTRARADAVRITLHTDNPATSHSGLTIVLRFAGGG